MQRVVLEKSDRTAPQSLEFRISKFQRERTEASIIYEVKSVRAIFDPDLAGGNGGYRCPPGTQNAGRWTDKFGRNCGIGVARRIGNAIGKIGGGEPAPARAVAAENRAQKLDERARKLEERAAGVVRKPAAPAISRVPKPRVGRADARKERKIRRLEEAAAQQEAVAQRLRPVEAEPEAPAKPKLVRAKPRVATPDRGKVVERRKIGVRGEGEGRGKPAPFKGANIWRKYGLNADDNAPMRAMTTEELEAVSEQVKNRVNARLGTREEREVLREIFNVIQVEENRRYEELVVNVPNLPPFKPGIAHDAVIGGAPKLRTLNAADFNQDEIDEMQTFLADIDKSLRDGRLTWDDKEKIDKYYEDLEGRVVKMQVRRDKLGSLLRSDRELAAHPELTRERQAEYFVSDEAIKRLDAERRIVRERSVILTNRNLALRYIEEAKDSKFSIAEKEDRIRRAELLMQNLAGQTVTNGAPYPDAVADVGEWDAKTAKELIRVKKNLQEFKDSVFGPTDKEGILEFGGKKLRSEQAQLDSLISDLNNAPLDKKAEAREALQAYRDVIRKQREGLGPVEERPEKKAENNLRKYLEIANMEATSAIRNSGGSKRLSLYDGIEATTDRPTILGEIGSSEGTLAIVSKSIASEREAIEHVRGGGSLSEVPNEFWYKAIKENSSKDKVDANTRFKEIPKKGGAIGETYIFVARDGDGKPTSKGYVLKAAEPDDNAGEVLSQHIMVEHGLPVEAAGWDGKSEKPGSDRNFVVLPFAVNGVENPTKIGGDYDNYDISNFKGVEAESIAPRVHALLHNYLLGVSDRHGGNGFTVIADGRPLAIPIDQGWAAYNNESMRDKGVPDLETYLSRVYSMDRNLSTAAQSALKTDKDEAHARAVVEVYDAMIERAESILEAGPLEWYNRISPGAPPNAFTRKRIEKIFRGYAQNLESLKDSRSNNLAKWMSKSLYDRVAA